MAAKYKSKVVFKYRSTSGKLVSKVFKTFKAAYDYAIKKGLTEFEIDSIRYFNI